jgi:TetR/AcrR family transcriptional regulator
VAEAAPPTRRSDATETRILDAAEELFARRGLRGTRVREIAETAGLSPGALYVHFPSKTALYQAVLDRGLRPVAAIAEEFGPDRRPPEIEALIARLLRHLADHPSLSRLVYVEAISEGPFLSHLARTWLRPLLERMMQLVKGGRRRHAWPDDRLPLLTASIVQVVFGHFALAPLLRETFDRDPLAPDALREQTRFLVEYFDRLFREYPREPAGGGGRT